MRGTTATHPSAARTHECGTAGRPHNGDAIRAPDAHPVAGDAGRRHARAPRAHVSLPHASQPRRPPRSPARISASRARNSRLLARATPKRARHNGDTSVDTPAPTGAGPTGGGTPERPTHITAPRAARPRRAPQSPAHLTASRARNSRTIIPRHTKTCAAQRQHQPGTPHPRVPGPQEAAHPGVPRTSQRPAQLDLVAHRSLPRTPPRPTHITVPRAARPRRAPQSPARISASRARNSRAIRARHDKTCAAQRQRHPALTCPRERGRREAAHPRASQRPAHTSASRAHLSAPRTPQRPAHTSALRARNSRLFSARRTKRARRSNGRG